MQKVGGFATASIITVILSVIATFTGHPFIGVILAVIAVPLGVFGLMHAASPKVSGGFVSIGGIIGGVLGAGLAVLGMIGVIIF